MSNEKYWIAFGDVHEKTANAAKIPGVEQAESLIVTGDLTNRGTRATAEKVYSELAASNPKIMAQMGNMDSQGVCDFLEEKNANIHLKTLELAPGIKMMGVGQSTPTPFGTPSEVDDATLKDWLYSTYEKLGQYDQMVLVVHDPPFGTKADDLGSAHVGSKSVRGFIEDKKPDICLTGHIHEAMAMDHIGPTLIINPGMLDGGGYVKLFLENSRLFAELRSI